MVEGLEGKKVVKVAVGIPTLLEKKISNMDLAYLAGFFDGEGTILLNRKGREIKGIRTRGARVELSIKVSGTDYDSIFRFQETFGGYLYKQSYRGKIGREHWKDCWQWSIKGGNAVIVLKLLQPYLTVKANQALLAFSFRKRQKEINTIRMTRGGHSKYTEEELNSLYDIRTVLHSMRSGRGERKYA